MSPIIRPKTFIGTGRLGIFQILFEWIREGRRIPIIGTGNNKYQLLSVDDLVDAIYRSTVQPNKNETFNIGAKEYGTVRQDLGALLKHAKSGSRLLPMAPWLVQPVLRVLELAKLSPLVEWHYKTANQDSFVDCSHAEEVLGWKAQKSNAQTLIETYDWYMQHYEEYLDKVGMTHRVAWDQGRAQLVQEDRLSLCSRATWCSISKAAACRVRGLLPFLKQGRRVDVASETVTLPVSRWQRQFRWVKFSSGCALCRDN
jgi:hypothetical protein